MLLVSTELPPAAGERERLELAVTRTRHIVGGEDPLCCEDLDFDGLTFAPRAVVWANGPNNEIKAYDVQVTRTIGYWKNHPAEDFSSWWTSDGTHLIIDTDRDGNWEVYSIELDGTNPVRLTTHPSDDEYPAWRP